jgi:hypothetical protein
VVPAREVIKVAPRARARGLITVLLDIQYASFGHLVGTTVPDTALKLALKPSFFMNDSLYDPPV